MINQFNLDKLSGFEWSQKQAEMDQMAACSEANATECAIDQQARWICLWHTVGFMIMDEFRVGDMCVLKRVADEDMDV